MERLSFVLPDFTRLAWVSDGARAVWGPRLARITRAWLDMEWLAVVEGLRRCAITTASPEGLPANAAAWIEHGLSNFPIEIQGLAGSSYSATSVRAELGKAFAYRVVVGAPADLAAFKRAWDRADQGAIGGLLGYPDCCRTFFRKVWVDQGMVDTTWPMAEVSALRVEGQREVVVKGPPEANILWRWMGLRPVPHLPCRVDCVATVALAEQFREVGRKHGFEEEVGWLFEVLRWPVEWSALHGIAEIRTPILRVSARTDATPTRYVVRREGESYPEDGAVGVRFPFRTPARPLLTSRPAFRRGLAAPRSSTGSRAEPPTLPVAGWYAGDNGFASIETMRQAHGPVIALAREELAGRRGYVLDLGCGNGALLGEIVRACPGIVPVGIDLDPKRVAHAKTLHPHHAENFFRGDLFASSLIWPEARRYALALLMPGRLIESGTDAAQRILAKLAAGSDSTLVYAYGDWLERYGGLEALARAAGIPLRPPACQDVALADLSAFTP